MKFKGLALLGLIPALLLSSISPSIADPTPSPSPSSTAFMSFKELMELYKLDLEKYTISQNTVMDPQTRSAQYKATNQIYQGLLDSRDELRIQINRTFMATVDKANKDARTAMKFARGASAKNDVITKQRIAITAASDIRDQAILELGDLPEPPIKPLKQVEPVSKGKAKTKKSNSITISGSDN